MTKVMMVTGSRKWENKNAIFYVLDHYEPDVVIHGGALGADSIAHEWCKKNGKIAHVFFPDYSKGKGAPLKRNIQMLEKKPMIVLGFPFPDSRGTRFTLKEAESRKIPCYVLEGGEDKCPDDRKG